MELLFGVGIIAFVFVTLLVLIGKISNNSRKIDGLEKRMK